mmetsp:Transcript_25665/g.37791  ORF Transcript_25665/g.37791 Transcript_25665/m.37791 type:complete len:262 (-) Transcript_25665:270-1055(-)|eukprot:CAMPEP_0195509976 /NCGR_PEP_ID=MMETSP0794_2-20130614/2753_1 /TAXON_ID=515487 /ORGANISM="Stephanopyxis turris, Strain CCMP 815" /LENGTH=261 /DNA_ID=CAMNT_0040637317 /DNA_START=122 /DNA_END=907 /DNA_ORIENTATION=+
MSTLLLVSGASRGLGRAISLQFARSKLLFNSPLRAVLLARGRIGLKETETQMREMRQHDLFIRKEMVDLSALETLEEIIEPILEQEAASTSHQRAILINCAGTTGYIGRTPSLNDIKEASDLNVVSKKYLSTRFAHHFGDSKGCTIVNISSMCAIKATPTMALYCATSAARDIYHTVLAADYPDINIVNYAPGSCDTDMQAMLRGHERLDPAVQAYCRGLVDGGLVDCQETAAELVRLVLEKDAFQSGERVDYVSMSNYKY